jgi:hypothetical protein
MLYRLETILDNYENQLFPAETEYYAPFPPFKLSAELTIGDAH